MAGDWIKMRVNLRKHPKVIAMARYLGGERAFMDWWSDPVRKTCHEHVTEIVTFENVTRVTVCGLLEVWGAVNVAVKDDGHVPYMTLIDLDDITGIPGFGEAMESVGWVSDHAEEGLLFSNFREFNTPESSRKAAKTDAERAREYRERKKQIAEQETRHERHETSRREEKRRSKDITPPVVPPSPKRAKFKPPTLEQVRAYCRERANTVDPEKWHDHYTANGWKVGKNAMKDWKAAVRTWEKPPDGTRQANPSRAKRHSDKLDEIIRKSAAGGSLDGGDIQEAASPLWPQMDVGYRRN